MEQVSEESAVHIILVDWVGYPLYRRRWMGRQKFRCGLGRLFDNFSKYEPGLRVTMSLIINTEVQYKPSLPEKWISKIPPLHFLIFGVRDWIRERRISQRMNRYVQFKDEHEFVKEILYRDNLGRDIGAYDFGLQRLAEVGYEGDVVFMNSNVRGPVADGWLLRYRELFHSNESLGLVGISMNSHGLHGLEFLPHVQSFFMYSSMDYLTKVYPHGFPGIRADIHKDDLITEGEIGISTLMLDCGFGIACIAYPEFIFSKGDDWKIPTGDLRVIKEYQPQVNRL